VKQLLEKVLCYGENMFELSRKTIVYIGNLRYNSELTKTKKKGSNNQSDQLITGYDFPDIHVTLYVLYDTCSVTDTLCIHMLTSFVTIDKRKRNKNLHFVQFKFALCTKRLATISFRWVNKYIINLGDFSLFFVE